MLSLVEHSEMTAFRTHFLHPVHLCSRPPTPQIITPKIRYKQRVNTPWLSECCQAVNKLSREKILFAQTHFLELTNQNTNIHTKIPKNRNRRNLLFEELSKQALSELHGGRGGHPIAAQSCQCSAGKPQEVSGGFPPPEILVFHEHSPKQFRPE